MNKYEKKMRAAVLLLSLFLLIGSSFVFSGQAQAATATWTGGGGDNEWTTDANWDTGSYPTSGDAAIINDGGATVDVSTNIAVTSLTLIDGSIDLDGYDLDIGNGNLSISGGTFELNADGIGGAGTVSIEHSLSINGGTVDFDGGSLLFDGSQTSDNTTFTCSSATDFDDDYNIGTITINKTNNPTVTIGSDCTVDAAMPGSDGYIVVNSGGEFNVTGDYESWSLDNYGIVSVAGTSFTIDNGSFVLRDGSTTTMNSVTAIDINDGSFVTQGDAGLSTNALSTMQVEKSFSVASTSTVDFNGADLTVNGSQSTDDTTFTCDVSADIDTDYNFGNIYFAKGNNPDIIIGENCTVDAQTQPGVDGLVYVNSGGVLNIIGNFEAYGLDSSGTFTVSGTSVIASDNNFALRSGSSTTMENVTTINIDDGTFFVGEDLTVSVPSLTLLQVERNYTVESGVTLDLADAVVELNGSQSEDDTTIISTSVAIPNLKVNKAVLQAVVAFSGDSTIFGDLDIDNGVINNPGSSTTVSVGGDLDCSGSDTVGGANLTIELNGSSAQSITSTCTNFDSEIIVNKPSGVASLAAGLSTDAACTVTDGSLDLAGYNMQCTSLTVDSGATLVVDGDETVTSLTFSSGANLEVQGDGDAAADTYTLGSGGAVLADISAVTGSLTVNMTDVADTFDFHEAFDLSGDLNITSGTLDMSTYDANVAGDITAGANGTLEANSQTVTLDGTAQTITGDITFYNLTKNVESADSLTLGAEDEVTVENTLDLKGDSVGSELTIASDDPGTVALLTLDSEGEADIEYLAVQDIDSSNGLAFSCTAGCTDSGNNTNWTFGRSSSKNRGEYIPPNPQIEAYIEEETDTSYIISWSVTDVTNTLVNIYLKHGNSTEEQIAKNYDASSYTIEKTTLFKEGNTTTTLRVAVTDLAEDLDDSTITFTEGQDPEVVEDEEETVIKDEDTNTTTFATGTLVKRADLPDVYIVAEDGTRRPFFNQHVFFAYNLSFDDIKTISKEDMASIRLGRPVPISSSKLLHFMGSSKIYEVLNTDAPTGSSSSKNQIRHIPTEAAAVASHGEDWKDKIISLPIGLFASYEVVE